MSYEKQWYLMWQEMTFFRKRLAPFNASMPRDCPEDRILRWKSQYREPEGNTEVGVDVCLSEEDRDLFIGRLVEISVEHKASYGSSSFAPFTHLERVTVCNSMQSVREWMELIKSPTREEIQVRMDRRLEEKKSAKY